MVEGNFGSPPEFTYGFGGIADLAGHVNVSPAGRFLHDVRCHSGKREKALENGADRSSVAGGKVVDFTDPASGKREEITPDDVSHVGKISPSLQVADGQSRRAFVVFNFYHLFGDC